MVNKTMFYIGLILIIISAILMVGNFPGENSSPIVLGILGIVFIGASKYRPLESRK